MAIRILIITLASMKYFIQYGDSENSTEAITTKHKEISEHLSRETKKEPRLIWYIVRRNRDLEAQIRSTEI